MLLLEIDPLLYIHIRTHFNPKSVKHQSEISPNCICKFTENFFEKFISKLKQTLNTKTRAVK